MSDRHVIERTFLHFPGIGPTKERGLWAQGIKSWDALGTALRNGTAPGDLVRREQTMQFELFPGLVSPTLHPTAQAWLETARDSEQALREGSHDFFLSRLPSAEHWRVLASVLNDALYLDIETTGLSRNFCQITVIGVLYRGRFHQWVWPTATTTLPNS
jgi:uncharacterized protein YprB with RNaseH-like and TPR domain